MKYCLFLLIGVLGAIFCSEQSYAQKVQPLVGSPAFDPNVYFPEFGSGIDSIYGSKDEQGLGGFLKNIGPKPNGANDRIMFTGLPKNIPFLSSVDAGANFDLHYLKVLKEMNFNPEWHTPYFGHFHDRKSKDMLIFPPPGNGPPKIYWSDNDGNYDTSNFSILSPKFFGDRYTYTTSTPYIAPLISDTIDDIITFAASTHDHITIHDTAFVILFHGGESLFSKGRYANQDSAVFFNEYIDGTSDVGRSITYADFRGTGMLDVIGISGYSDWFVYRREGHFALDDFIHSMKVDTFFAKWQNPKYISVRNTFTMRALPKTPWNNSVDFLPEIAAQGKGGIFIFRGGPDFGNNRLFIDSAELLIPPPSYFDPAFAGIRWPGTLTDCGDMTGTGNRVLYAGGGILSSPYYFFYVLGKAADDKIDMAFTMDRFGGGIADTIDANSDGMMDAIFDASVFTTPADYDGKGWKNVGSIQLVFGSKKIPVRLNPKYSITYSNITEPILSVFPNPFRRRTAVTISQMVSGSYHLSLRDVLGREVHKIQIVSQGENESFIMETPALQSGAYFLRLESGKSTHTLKVIIIP